MSGVLGPVGDVHRSRDLAQRLLEDLPERWRHTIGVARRAETVAGTVGSRGDGEVLMAAAWLHDIGYAAPLRDTGFHPVDGALFRCPRSVTWQTSRSGSVHGAISSVPSPYSTAGGQLTDGEG